MIKDNKFKAVYLPDIAINNPITLTNLCIYFDEIHIFPPIFDIYIAKSVKESYDKSLVEETENCSPSFFLEVCDQISDGLNIKVDKMNQFYRDNEILHNEIIFNNTPEILDISKKFINSCFRNDGSNYKNIYIETIQNSGLAPNEAFHYSMQKTAIDEYNMLPISDYSYDNFKKTATNKLSETLAWAIADECLSIAIPCANAIPPEVILEIREKLKDELIPFRMAMLALVDDLTSKMVDLKELNIVTGNLADMKEVKLVAEHIAKTKVQPTLSDLKRKIEQEKSKLWRKVFGKTISWIPIIAKLIISPSPDLIYRAVENGGKSMEELLLSAQGITSVQQQGLNFLLKLRNYSA